MAGKNFRNFIDITPHDKNGYSFWGLKRTQAKLIASALIIFSIFLMVPPGFLLDPTDFINIFLAKYLVTTLGLNAILAVVLTHTVIPWSIFLVGIYIYPHNTMSLFNGYINKVRRFFTKNYNKPYFWLGAALFTYIMIQIYSRLL